jgi:hypothetical protein
MRELTADLVKHGIVKINDEDTLNLSRSACMGGT